MVIIMKLLVCSTEDQASINIRDRLIDCRPWVETGPFMGHPSYRHGDYLMVTIDLFHLEADHLDRAVQDELGIEPQEVIFLSRHKSASGRPSLTIHPIGNYSQADYGGKEETLVPSSPYYMTDVLRTLAARGEELGFDISFEVTHHGPFLETPSMYIEIGSDRTMWEHTEAARAIAASLLDSEGRQFPSAIGIGGGHYAPRFTDVALSWRISFGHMIPDYALDVDEERLRTMIVSAMEKSDYPSFVYLHPDSMSQSMITEVESIVREQGAEIVNSDSLDPL